MIEIKRIKPKTIDLYHEEQGLVGQALNEYEFNECRIQINDGNLKGYYVLFNDEKIRIDHNGILERWPKGLFDIISDQLCRLQVW